MNYVEETQGIKNSDGDEIGSAHPHMTFAINNSGGAERSSITCHLLLLVEHSKKYVWF